MTIKYDKILDELREQDQGGSGGSGGSVLLAKKYNPLAESGILICSKYNVSAN